MRNLNRRERESERVSRSKGAVYAPLVWWLWVGVIECAARRCLRSGWSLLSMRPVPSQRVRRELVRFENDLLTSAVVGASNSAHRINVTRAADCIATLITTSRNKHRLFP